VQHEKFKDKFKGRPHDFIGFDEIADFSESQFRFLIAWNRSTDANQRCRVVCVGNPPTYVQGEWVIRYWAPWLSKAHPNPAKPGELRYFAVLDGKDVECDTDKPFRHKGETIRPLSRTFIPSRLSDNPFLRDTNYEAVLQGLPEPLRSKLLYGSFEVETPDSPQQVIPTEWVKAAQHRWRERSSGIESSPNNESLPDNLGPITVVGVDPSRGGRDATEIALRAGNYYLPLKSYPGVSVPDGPTCAGLVAEAVGEHYEAQINIDVIGVGASVYDILVAQDYLVYAVNFAEASDATDKSGRLKLRNVRAEAYWKMREALDPESGDDIALPPGDELIADLVAPRWKMTTRGVTVEPKADIRKRLKRSPGKGDAIVLANYKPISGVFFK